MEKYKQEFIEFMVKSNVLKFGQFVTKSGRQTPFFINTGNYTTGEQLEKLGQFYAQTIKERIGTDIDVLFGPAYKGIPLTVTTAIAMNNLYGVNVEYCSNRKEIKDHGEGGILLGAKLDNTKKVVIVEDVMTAGTSIYETAPILKAQGDVEISGLVISVDRMEKGRGEKSAQSEIKEAFGITTYPIVTMAEVVEYLYNREINGTIYIDDNIKVAILIQAKHHKGETNGWAVEQIDNYKKQLEDPNYELDLDADNYTYIPWVISTCEDFSDEAKNKAKDCKIRLINGKEFARMILEQGLQNIDLE